MAEAEIGVIGTMAETSPLDDGEELVVDTPYGFPSSPICVGDVGGKRVAFLSRRGEEGDISPPRIPSRANIWALRELGCEAAVVGKAFYVGTIKLSEVVRG